MMPYTKRKPHYNTTTTLIDYILNDDKTDNGLLTSSLNCSVDFAAKEFKNNNIKWKAKGNRVAYHLVQSFHPDDPITPEQANELGKRLCEELYGEFQCVIATHIDRRHIHNHIAINAVSVNGRKLEDRLANKNEGIYGYKVVSDRLAKEYGCFVLPAQTISIHKNKDYYYEYKAQSWKETIKADIDRIKTKCSSIDEMYEELIALGYDITNGKHPAIKAVGMKKYARFYKLGAGYDIEELKEYFGEQEQPKDIKNLAEINVNVTNFNEIRVLKAKESRIAILITSKAAQNGKYGLYQKTRYEEIKRFYQLKAELDTIASMDINSYEELSSNIEQLRREIKGVNTEIQKIKNENKDILKSAEKAQDYIRLYKIKEYADYYKSIDKDYELPVEAKVFIKIQDELNINTTNEAYAIIDNARNVRLELHQMKSSVLELQRQLNKLDTLKEEQLIKTELFIHNIKFGGNRIDYENSTDDKWCVKLPYCSEYMFIEKSQTTFNNKYQYYTIFLVDDKKYNIYTEDEIKELIQNNKDKNKKDDKNDIPPSMLTMKGTDIENMVLDNKAIVTQQYNKENIEE